jgi:hypothetical protein
MGQSHLFLTCAYEGIILPLAVRDYLHRKKLTRQADRRPSLSPGALQSVFAGCSPHMQGNRVLMRRRSCTQRTREAVPPPFYSPLIEGPTRGVSTTCLFASCPAAYRSPFLSLCGYVCSPGACFVSHFAASSSELASRSSPRSPPRPCAKS